MTVPVRGEGTAAAEELVLGPRPRTPLPRPLLLAALALALLLVGVFAIWHFRPEPPAPLSLAELQDGYAGMVRSDGVNDASVLSRRNSTPTLPVVTPRACLPLVETTVGNHFPEAAQDGVGTYWLETTWSISLFTLRFDDEAAAKTELATIATALDECTNQHVTLRGDEPSTTADWHATVRRIDDQAPGDRLSYTLSVPDGLMVIQLMVYLNTVSWQFRYANGVTDYVPDPADQLLTGLNDQLEAVVAARHG